MRYASFFLVMIFGGICVAQPTTAPAAKDGDIVTRVYDISDMTWRKSDYPAAGAPGFAPVTGGFPGADPSQATVPPSATGDIIHLITDTIASDTWKDNGGNIGAVREIGGQLLVSQTPENHKLLADLFQQLREGRGRMVVVRAYWLLLDPASVPSSTRKGNAGKELQVVEDNLIDAKHLYCAAQTTCFNAQTIHVTSGRKRNVLTGLQPVVGSNSVGYQPTLGTTQSGVVLQLTPHLEPEGPDARIVLDLQSDVTQLSDVSDKIQIPATTQPSDAVAAIDRMNEVTQALQTTVRLPLGKKVLVGGMTLEPTRNGDAQQLYLVIEVDAVK